MTIPPKSTLEPVLMWVSFFLVHHLHKQAMCCQCSAFCQVTVNWDSLQCSQTFYFAISASPVVTHSLLCLDVFGLIRLGVRRCARGRLGDGGCFCCCCCYCCCFLFTHTSPHKHRKALARATLSIHAYSSVCHFCVDRGKWSWWVLSVIHKNDIHDQLQPTELIPQPDLLNQEWHLQQY